MDKKRELIIWVVVFALVIVAAVAIYNVLSKQNTPNNLSTGSSNESSSSEKTPAPDFVVYDEHGLPIKLSEVGDKPIVVNFWASWCPPCKDEMPDFQAAYETYGNDVVFMMINATDGSRETVDTATSYLTENGFTFPAYFDSDASAEQAFGITGYPETFFIDKNGNIVAHAEGALNKGTLKKGIDMISQ